MIASQEAECAEVKSAGFDYSLYKMLPREIAGGRVHGISCTIFVTS